MAQGRRGTLLGTIGRRVMPVLAATLVIALTSCGGTDGVAPTSTLAVRTTDFATLAPVQTTEPPPTIPPSTLPEPQEYVVVSGDNPTAIAQRYGVSLQALIAVNGWTDVATQFPFPGQTIIIPAGGKNPAYIPVDQTTTSLATDDDADGSGGGVDGDAGGTYIIVAGDYPFKIAEQFGVSLQALAAANGWENLSRDFPLPGSMILIPPQAG